MDCPPLTDSHMSQIIFMMEKLATKIDAKFNLMMLMSCDEENEIKLQNCIILIVWKWKWVETIN